MRRTPPETDAAMRPGGSVGRWRLFGLFCAVWALVIQFSLPLALQLTPGHWPATYDLTAAAGGLIHSAHGKASGDHSLPVRPDVEGFIVKSETPALHCPGVSTAALCAAAAVHHRSDRPHQVVFSGFIDDTRLTRAPPLFGQSPHIV